MVRLVTFSLVVFSAGCGDDSRPVDRSEPGNCAQRSGTFSSVFRERSGNCGPIPEQIETVAEQPTEIPSPCSGTIGYSDDNCEVTAAYSCPEDGLGDGWSSAIELFVEWNEPGTRGEGVEQIRVFDSEGLAACQGTYDVTSNRL